MKILFVKPYSRSQFRSTIGPDAGFAYLATALRKQGIGDISVLDLSNHHLNINEFVDYVRKHRPDVVGFRLFSTDCADVSRLSTALKARMPDIISIAGGPHPSLADGNFPEMFPYIDYAFRGEAELGLPQLIKHLAKGHPPERSLESVPSLMWRSKGVVVRNNIQRIEDLDSIGLPSWDLMDIPSYGKNAGVHGMFTPILFTRGCPFSCAFCGGPLISGRKMRFRSYTYILEEMKIFTEEYNIESLMISDDNPTLNRSYFMGLLDAIITSGIGMKFYTFNGIRVDTLDEDMVVRMEQAGFQNIVMSIESGSKRTLSKMNKELDLEIIPEKAEMIRRLTNMELHAYFIIGYPDETISDIGKTISLARKLPLDRADFSLFTPHPGTHIYRELLKKKMLKKIDFRSFDYQQASIGSGIISKRKMKLLHLFSYLIFYSQPHIIFDILKDTRSLKDIRCMMAKLFNTVNPLLKSFVEKYDRRKT